jgi:O-antigen/teichoic acid export membrane protein
MSLRRKATIGFLWAVTQTATQQAAGLLTFTIMAGMLGPRPYGLVAMELVILYLVSIVLTQGLLEGLLQRAEIRSIQLDSMFWFVQAASILIALGMFATAGQVARLYGQPELVGIQRGLSLVPICIGAAAVPGVLVRRQLRFRTFAICAMIAEAVGAIVGIGLAVAGFGAWAIVGNLLTLQVVSVIVLWAATSWRPGLQFLWREIRGLLAYGLQVVCIRGLTVLDNQGPRFVVGYGLGPVALGSLHFGGTALGFLTQLFTTPFSIVSVPVVARIQTEPEKIERLMWTATRMANLLMYPAFIGLGTIAPILVPAVFGAKWLPAVPVIQVLSVAGLARIYVDMYDATLRGIGRPKWVVVTRAAQALLTVILALWTVRYGVVAVAAVLAFKGIVFLPINVWILQRVGGPRLGPVLTGNLPILGTAMLMGGCVFGWIHLMREELDAWLLLGTSIAIGLTSYTLFALICIRSALRDMFSLLRSLFLAKCTKLGHN